MVPLGRAQAELEDRLEPPAEILIEETVNNRVHATVEESQPVCKGVNVNVYDSVLVLGESGIVTQHHQCPQREPRHDEQ